VLLDAHCHVDRFPNPESIAAACERQRVTTVAVTNLPSHFKVGNQHVGGLQYVKLALGFHPLAVGKQHGELEEFLRLLPVAAFVGEIGLDYSKEGASTKREQLATFRAIAEALMGTQKFVTIHSRGAEDAVLDVLAEFQIQNPVLHWYSGTLAVLERAVEQGCFFSLNPAMIRSKKGQGIIARIPRARILTETDGPYVKIGSRSAEPSDVRGVVEFLAREWNVPLSEAIGQVFENFRIIVGEATQG